jgi:hypothetical protein
LFSSLLFSSLLFMVPILRFIERIRNCEVHCLKIYRFAQCTLWFKICDVSPYCHLMQDTLCTSEITHTVQVRIATLPVLKTYNII